MTLPPPRNALDADLWPWNSAVPSPLPFGENADRADFWCASPSAAAAGGASSLNLTGQSGQACYWCAARMRPNAAAAGRTELSWTGLNY